MKLLAISFDLPPLLRPQAIQIGRLLQYLPENLDIYAVTADDRSCPKDTDLYPGLSRRFREQIIYPFRSNVLLRAVRFLTRVLLPVPDAYLFWHYSVFREIVAKWKDRRFDAIVTFAFPMSTNLLGMWLKKYYKVRWVAFLSDPWADNPHLRYTRFANKINGWLEKRVFEHADKLVFPSHEMRDQYVVKYPMLKNKMEYLNHSFDPSSYAEEAPSTQGPLLLRYIGNFYGQRSAETLLAALGALLRKGVIAEGDIVLETVGGMPKRHSALYVGLLKKHGLQNIVKIKAPVPYQTSLKLMQESDVLVLLDAAVEGSVYFPSKLADYIGTRRPIFGITPHEGTSARIIRKVGGWIAAPNRQLEIEQQLFVLIDKHKKGLLPSHPIGDEALTEFSIHKNALRAEQIITGKEP